MPDLAPKNVLGSILVQQRKRESIGSQEDGALPKLQEEIRDLNAEVKTTVRRWVLARWRSSDIGENKFIPLGASSLVSMAGSWNYQAGVALYISSRVGGASQPLFP